MKGVVMPYLFGDITTWYWNGLDKLRRLTNRKLFVVKVCNTAKRQTWDYEWRTVYPDWADINAYRLGHMAWAEFRERYMLKLEQNAESIISGFNELVANANHKMIVLTCHELPGDNCHRTILLEWLMAKHLVYHLLNCDRIICDDCYQEISDERGDAWTEDEYNMVVGKSTHGPCETCWR